MDEELILTLAHPVASLTLNREELRNAISFPMYKRIPELIGRVQADPRVKVLVIRGSAGAGFCRRRQLVSIAGEMLKK